MLANDWALLRSMSSLDTRSNLCTHSIGSESEGLEAIDEGDMGHAEKTPRRHMVPQFALLNSILVRSRAYCNVV